MVWSLVPLLVIGATAIGVLGTAYRQVVAELRPATAVARATVTTGGVGRDGLSLRWTDGAGAAHVSRLVFPRTGDVPAGTAVEVRYVPGDPSRVYSAADEPNTRGRGYLSGVTFGVLVLVVALVGTGYRLVRRVRLERRPARSLPVRWAASKRGLIQRSWLVVTDGDREWWQPVYWQPGLPDLLAGTPCPVRGTPATGRLLLAEVGGQPVWPSGRCRRRPPAGELTENLVAWTRAQQRRRDRDATGTAPPISMTRHLLGDIGLVLPAPVLGLLWAYFDGSGTEGFVVATALLFGVLFWLPGVFGSDPT